MSNPSMQVRKLLSTFEKFLEQAELSLDDDEKMKYQTKLLHKRAELQDYATRLEEAEKLGNSGIAKIVAIHSELFKKLFG